MISVPLDHPDVEVTLEVIAGRFVEVKIAGDDAAVRDFVKLLGGPHALPTPPTD